MQKVNKHTVLKVARDKGYWCGYIAGNKVNEYHIAGGWNLGKTSHFGLKIRSGADPIQRR